MPLGLRRRRPGSGAGEGHRGHEQCGHEHRESQRRRHSSSIGGRRINLESSRPAADQFRKGGCHGGGAARRRSSARGRGAPAGARRATEARPRGASTRLGLRLCAIRCRAAPIRSAKMLLAEAGVRSSASTRSRTSASPSSIDQVVLRLRVVAVSLQQQRSLAGASGRASVEQQSEPTVVVVSTRDRPVRSRRSGRAPRLERSPSSDEVPRSQVTNTCSREAPGAGPGRDSSSCGGGSARSHRPATTRRSQANAASGSASSVSPIVSR